MLDVGHIARYISIAEFLGEKEMGVLRTEKKAELAFDILDK